MGGCRSKDRKGLSPPFILHFPQAETLILVFWAQTLMDALIKSDKKLRLLDDDHLRLCYKNLYPKNEKDKYSLYSLPKSNSLKTPEISNGFQDTPFLIWDGQVADGQGLEQDRFVKIHEFRTTWSSSSLCCYLAAKIYCLKLFGVEGMLESFGGGKNCLICDLCVLLKEKESKIKNNFEVRESSRHARLARWHQDEKSGVNSNGKGIENNCWGMPDF